jgi:hypothetical protein
MQVRGRIPTKIRNTIVNLRSLIGMPGIEFRLHGTVLYNSIYRADDQMLVNAHVYGIGAYLAPILQLRHLPGADLFTTYLNSFEAVWATSLALAAAVSTLERTRTPPSTLATRDLRRTVRRMATPTASAKPTTRVAASVVRPRTERRRVNNR